MLIFISSVNTDTAVAAAAAASAPPPPPPQSIHPKSSAAFQDAVDPYMESIMEARPLLIFMAFVLAMGTAVLEIINI